METTRTASKVFIFTALTGTDTTALDGWDGDDLINGDLAIVKSSGVIYFYVLDHDNSSAESSPGIIQPNKNYGTKRWVLQSIQIQKDQNSTTIFQIRNNDSGGLAYIMLALGAYGNTWGIRVGSMAADSNEFNLVTDALGTPTRRIAADTSGNFWVENACSALSFTDRTKFPETVQQAYAALASMTGQAGKVDHSKLDPFIKGKPDVDKDGKETPTRDLGALVSCQAAVINDLILRIEKLEKK